MNINDYESLLEPCRQCDHLDNCVKLVASPLTGDICYNTSNCPHYEVLSQYVVDQIVQVWENIGYIDKIYDKF